MNDSRTPDPRRRVCAELAERLATPEGRRAVRLAQLTGVLAPVAAPPGAPQPEAAPPEAAPPEAPQPVTAPPEAPQPMAASPEAPEPMAAPPVAPHPATAPPEADEPRPISIWQPRVEDGETIFVRPDPLPLGDHYARRRTLRAAKPPGTCRVVFFGESAAAGYLYAPHLTPAGEIERLLRGAGGEERFEVVDLARTNERLGPLVETVERSLQLDPDVLVLFAGNNWNLLETPEVSPYVPSVRARQRYALALRRDGDAPAGAGRDAVARGDAGRDGDGTAGAGRDGAASGGIAGPPRFARRLRRRRAEAALARVAAVASARGLPVVVVVPEVNLADWHDRQPVTWLPGDGTARWWRHYRRAREHLEAGRRRAVLEEAEAMLELDGGRCPTGHRLRALALGPDGPETRQACEAEVAAGEYATLAFLGSPRASAADQALLRRAAERHGFGLVDLPAIFAEATGGALPGDRLFLDYCHLSLEGIRILAAAVAAEVLRLRGDPSSAGGRGRSPFEKGGDGGGFSAGRRSGLSSEHEALAHLGAAVHGAHRLLAVGDKRAVLERHCRRALERSPGIAEAMRDLVAARCASCPAVLTRAQVRNFDSRYRLLLAHGWRWDHLDAELLLAIRAVLAERGEPIELDAPLLENHRIDERGVELARAPYLWEPLDRFYPEAMAAAGYAGRAAYRSPWPESSFCLVAEGGEELEILLTARLPEKKIPPSPPFSKGGTRSEEVPGASGVEVRSEAVSGASGVEVRSEAVSGVSGVVVRLDGEPVATLDLDATWRRHRFSLTPEPGSTVLRRLTLRWPDPSPSGDAALADAILRLEDGVEADLHPVFGEIFSLRARRADSG